ncbi:hypothetical protein B0H14DRAFT_2563216 [Mycena olivaceomarginata]|nr:hypothetical protein B0H14DRAFT_2563216 [Mycena olivaceomarginata]
MDVDNPGLYNPINVEKPRVYIPMDVDETGNFVSHLDSSGANTFHKNYESLLDGNTRPVNTSDQSSNPELPEELITFHRNEFASCEVFRGSRKTRYPESSRNM